MRSIYFLLIFFFSVSALNAVESQHERYLASPTLDQRLHEHLKYNPEGPNSVGYIKIEGSSGISEATWLYVKKALEYYKKSKPVFIILELNTPGGEVFAAQKISDALKNIDTQNDIPVIAYINNWAISAGAMLAYSSRFIAASKDASMGAAEPVLASQTGEMQSASEKVNSAIRADFANRASFFDRNPNIAEAMVDKDLILVLRDGKVIKVDSEAQIRTAEPNPDILVSPKGKLLTLGSELLMRYGVADLILYPTKLEPVTVEEQEKGKWPASKSALFQYPYLAKIPNAVIDTYQMDWKTRFFVMLANPVVSSILVLGLMLGFYMEMSSPGFGFAGTLAFICLFFIILSSLSLEIAGWLEVILLISGLLIILVDLFVLPTFGLIGIFGALLFLAGLFGILLPNIGAVDFDFDTQTLNAAGTAFIDRLAWFSATIIIGLLLILFINRYISPRIALWSRLVLTGNEQDASEGYIAGEKTKDLPPVGTEGVALTMLRPAGKVMINDRLYDAISSGNFIDKDTPIIVTRLDGSVIVVDIRF